MLRNPLTSRVSFLLYGVMAAELLTRFSLGDWVLLVVLLSIIETRIERRGRI